MSDQIRDSDLDPCLIGTIVITAPFELLEPLDVNWVGDVWNVRIVTMHTHHHHHSATVGDFDIQMSHLTRTNMNTHVISTGKATVDRVFETPENVPLGILSTAVSVLIFGLRLQLIPQFIEPAVIRSRVIHESEQPTGPKEHEAKQNEDHPLTLIKRCHFLFSRVLRPFGRSLN
ncbi:MAG TPA: hypothetical protein VJG67_02705 [Candidatus Paceibacterota bacterium]